MMRLILKLYSLPIQNHFKIISNNSPIISNNSYPFLSNSKIPFKFQNI
ncbi:hypothetical protein HMPREF1408_00244 [Helicobacter pylori GAM245Ai]|nr:hypothetical protein HMPREF1408_00244 [Helicobacter pylori GAM245Ai]